MTVSLKTRQSHLPSDFIFPPKQDPGSFPDTYGLMGKWCGPRTAPYTKLELIGYFTADDWEAHHTSIEIPSQSLNSKSTTPYRRAYLAQDLRPLDQFLYEIESEPDEAIHAVQTYGYLRSLGEWFRSGGDTVQRWDLYATLDH